MTAQGRSRALLEVSQFGDVTQIKLSQEDEGRPLYWTTAYLVDGLLIDTGCVHTVEELVAYLEGQELAVRTVVSTHYHEDHVAGNRRIQERFGARLLAHPVAVTEMARVPDLQPYRAVIWGYPEPCLAEPVGPEIHTPSFRFEVIDTPGHCPGHVALLERENGWCFSGDLYVGARLKAIRPDEDVAAIVSSLERLAALATEGMEGPARGLTLFTGIGRVVEDGRRALLDCAAHLRDMAAKARQLQRKGLPEAAIRDEFFGRESVLDTLTGGHYSAANLVRALLSSSPDG